MNLEITKYANSKYSTEYLAIEKMTKVLEPKSLLFVTEFEMEENGHKIRNISIKKVQFIANCKTKIENELLVAFYIHDEGYLESYIISGLEGNYTSEQGHLVDYKSYAEICDLTGETKLSFEEYYEQLKNGYIGINTIAYFNKKSYNFTEQKEMWNLVNS